MSTLEHAISIAAEAHAGQVDKAGEPYILHPLRVMGAMSSAPGRIVAVLHDVVEDCPPWCVEALAARGFDPDVCRAVDELGRPKGLAYEVYIEGLADRGSYLARCVKLADLRDNLDPRRLARLPAGDAQRFAARYRPAMQRLLATICPGVL